MLSIVGMQEKKDEKNNISCADMTE